jgi:hypothetical protein
VKILYPLRGLLILVMLLSIPALACQLTGGGNDEEAERPALSEEDGLAGEDSSSPARPDPAATPEPADEAPAFADLQTNAAMADFDSYRLDMTIMFEGTSDGDARSGTMRFQSAIVTEPASSQVVVTFEGDLSEEMEGVESLTFTEIDGRSYTIFPGFGCITGSADETDAMTEDFEGVMNTEEILGEINDAEYIGEEIINGVATYHYRFDETNVDEESDFEEMEGHVYVAQQGGYVVRMVVDGKGAVDLFDSETEAGNIHLEYAISDVNVPIEINPPDECAGVEAEFPVMSGATSLASMAGFTSYEVEATLEDVQSFYEEEMAALGYSSDEDAMTMEGFAMLSFAQDGEGVMVTLSEDDGVVSVLITTTGE